MHVLLCILLFISLLVTVTVLSLVASTCVTCNYNKFSIFNPGYIQNTA